MVGLSKKYIPSSKIAIDARMISSQSMHGIARYVYELLKGLSRIRTEHQFYVIVQEQSPLLELRWPSHINLVVLKTAWISVKEQWTLPLLLKKYKIDLFHTPSFVAPVMCPSKMIVTLHDLNHLVLPQYYTWIHKIYYNTIVRYAASQSSYILTVSEFSKNEIVKHLGVRKEKVFVTYNGVSESFKPVIEKDLLKRVREKYGLPKSFLLCFSNSKPHKNIYPFVVSYMSSKIQADLVIVGALETRVSSLIEGQMRKRVHSIPYIAEEDLAAVYSLCQAYVFPSLYEGFGLPPLEALACGAPVIVSDSSSIPEVVGEHAFYLDPSLSTEEMRKRLEAITNALNEGENPFRSAGILHAGQFTWEKMVEKTLSLYNRCLGDYQKS